MISKDIAFWNKIARKYAGDPIQDLQAYEETLNRIKSYLTPQDVVLEIGCGTGSTALVLAPLVKSLCATDASATMIEIAQEKLVADSATNIEFLYSSLSDVGEGGEHYDVVLALNVLHLIHDFPLALRKVHSKLKPDGLFISKTICMPPAKGRFKFWLITRLIPLARFFGQAPFAKIPEIDDLEHCIADAGFELIERGDYPKNPPRRFIVARKK